MTEKSPAYLAVYGAMVALQVRDYMSDSYDALDKEIMARFIEKAHVVASMAEDIERENNIKKYKDSLINNV